MKYVDTAKKLNLKPVNNINSCNRFNCICLSKVTFLQLNDSEIINYILMRVVISRKKNLLNINKKMNLSIINGRDYSSVKVGM